MNLVFDIGGTHIRTGLISDDNKLLRTSLFLTPKKYIEGIERIINFVRLENVRVNRICVGVAGVFHEGKLYSSPNLKGWVKKPIKEDLEKELKAQVFIENDAALAGLGEAVYGAGKDYKIVSYFTISTGVGGSRIVNGNIDEKVYGFEPGHQIICGNDQRCEAIAPLRCKFESLVSGKSIKKIYGESPEKITDEKIWGDIIKNTAVGISNSIYFWSPEVVILGGGVTHSDHFDIELLKKEVEKIIKKTYPSTPEFKKSTLGDYSGIWGGIAYLNANTL